MFHKDSSTKNKSRIYTNFMLQYKLRRDIVFRDNIYALKHCVRYVVFQAQTYFTSKSYKHVRDEVNGKFPQFMLPKKSTILWCLVDKFHDTGSVQNWKNSSRPSLLTVENWILSPMKYQNVIFTDWAAFNFCCHKEVKTVQYKLSKRCLYLFWNILKNPSTTQLNILLFLKSLFGDLKNAKIL